MSETRIPPALTPDEWADKALSARGRTCPPLSAYIDADDGEIVIAGGWVEPDERHAIAALCLHQQTFGFTQEEYHALVACLPVEPDSYEERMSPDAATVAAAWAAVQKIAALLPPPSSPERP